MRERIVFLDASTVDYGDIDFSTIEEFGEFKAYKFTKPEGVLERIKDASIVITNKVVLNDRTLDECKGLKLIAVAATGYNIVNIDYASQREIAVANVPGYSTFSVAQLTLTFILALATNLIRYNNASRDGTWSRSDVFTLGSWPTFDLSNKVLGILGMGAIGRKVATLARAFDMQIIALKREGAYYNDDFERYNLHELAGLSDFVTIHLPLTPESEYLIDREFFRAMKRESFLINMSRGPIVRQDALERALKNGEIAGAAIDVMEVEPPERDNPLLQIPNLIVTPHIAWASVESRRRLIREIAENIRAFLSGDSRNLVY
jgi:glycerate dehydrogenase